MSSEEALLEAPFTLASLPKPYDATTGRSLASPVYGLRGQRWRKRSEIAVGVDGDGISIYNVRNPRLITSYALPPQTRILCAPCSVYYKPAGQKATRVTYAAVTNDSTKKTEIVSFVDEALSDSSDVSTESQTKTSYALKGKKGVFAIYALASHSDNKDLASALDICIIYEDGSVDSISGDIVTPRWAADAAEAVALAQGAASKSLGRVEYATVTDVEKARKGLLKGREDVLAVILGAAIADDQAALNVNVPLLILATASEDSTRHVHIFSLPSRSKDLITSNHPGLRHLLTHDLPASQSSVTASDRASFSLHPSSGRLQQLLQGELTTFDFSATLPRLLSSLSPRSEAEYTSFVRISPALVMASDASTCGIYDTKYSSLQGQLPLSGESVDASPGKRKRSDSQSAPLHFVSFYADIGLAVAISGNTLVGLQVNISAPAYKKAKSGASLLINSLAKGFTDHSQVDAEAEAAFDAWKVQVDGFLAEANIDALERFIAVELDLAGVAAVKHKSSKTHRGKQGKNYQSGSIDALASAAPDQDEDKTLQLARVGSAPQSWDLRNAGLLTQKTDRRKALYMLTKIFATRSPLAAGQPSITILFFAPNIFKWLALTGYLNPSTLSRALSTSVKPGDIMLAVNELDPEMHIMHLLLTLPIHLSLADICVALRTLIKSLDDPKPGLISKLISTGGLSTSLLPNALATEDEAGALDAAEADLDYAVAQLENGLGVRSTSLRTVFHRLNSFPAATIISALRTHLQQQHLTFFIQLLRVELADGGWTTRYLDAIISPRVHELIDGERPADNSLTIISNLLSCGIDAIGLQGWMVPPSAEKDSVIETLRAETSAALEGAHEAAEMSIYLGDFERFALAAREAAKEERKESRVVGKVDAVKRPGFEEVKEGVDPILPMGGKVVKVEKMLVRSGGREQKKSKSLLGKEQSMRVGKYSFDRIRV